MTPMDVKKRQKRLQTIAFATTDYNEAKNEFFNDKTPTSAQNLITKAGQVIKLQKMHDLSIQDNHLIQARIDTAKEFLKSYSDDTVTKQYTASEAAIKKVGKLNTQRLQEQRNK